MVSQVTPVAILMIVQGALEIIMGFVLVGAALIVPAVFEEAARQQQAQGGANAFPGMPAGFEQFAGWLYSGMAACGFLSGVIRLSAGIRNVRFRGRTFGIFSHFFCGFLSLGTCYCSLTGIGLLIYGLIVYFNSDVAYAFTLGERGIPSGEIKARYYNDPDRFQAGGGSHERERRDEREDDGPLEDDRPDRPQQGDQFYGKS